MAVLVSNGATGTVRIERDSQRSASQAPAMSCQGMPIGRPTEFNQCDARKSEGEVKTSDPGSRQAQPRFVLRKRLQKVDRTQFEKIVVQFAARHDDRLRASRRAREIDPEDQRGASREVMSGPNARPRATRTMLANPQTRRVRTVHRPTNDRAG